MDYEQTIRVLMDDLVRKVECGQVGIRLPPSVAPGVPPQDPDSVHAFIEGGVPYTGGWRLQYHVVPELFFQIAGANRYTFSPGEVRLAQGEILLMPRLVPHMETVCGDGRKFQMLVIWFFQGEMICSIAGASAHNTPHVLYNERYPRVVSAPLIRLLDSACELADLDGDVREQAMRGVVCAFLIRMRHVLARKGCIRGEHEKMAQIRRLVSRRLESPDLSVREIAHELHSSADYISALFHRETGETLIKYITEKRMEQAVLLLRRPDLNIAEVAGLCGFGDAAYFSFCFRKRYGMPPRRYKAEHG